MRRNIAFASILLGLILATSAAHAQNTTGLVVTSCATPTYNAGNPGPFTVDTHGNLCINASGGGGGSVTQGTVPWVVGTTQWGGGTLGAMANYGTSPGAVLVPGVNAFVTSLPAITGTVTANQGTSPWVISGAVTNAGTFAVQASQSTAANLNATVVGTGTFATQATLSAGTAAIGTVTGNVNVTPTDCSGTITSGGSAQNAFAATATIHGFTIANIDSTAGSGEPLWISFTTTAAPSTAASYPLPAPAATTFSGMGSYTSPLGYGLNTALSVIGATTGHKFSCTRW